MQIKILKETDSYLVLNKPAGISVHGDGKREEYTLVDWLLENYPDVKGVGEDLETDHGIIEKPGIVHRLDKDTSGVILVTLNQKAYKHFKKQFKNREIKKFYHLFAYGNIKTDLFKVDAEIGKDRKDFRRRTTKNPRGKVREAETDFRILNRGKDGDELFVFVEAMPRTGRMHQIRVHMWHKNNPLVCDKLYSPKREPILGFERMALHARKLIFKDLEDNEIEVIAEYPEDFENALSMLQD
jgi:23S rRNA pseudouridine1911/1915/1917 synthase